MELRAAKIAVVFFVLNVGHVCRGQGPPLEVTIPEGDQQVWAGQSATLTCSINRKVTLIMDHGVVWAHRSLATGAERNLTLQASHGPDASPDHFGIDLVTSDGSIGFQLQILGATDAEDGEYMCKVFSKKSGVTLVTKLVTVTVLHDVEHVSLMFDGSERVTGEDNRAIELEEGEHGVMCEVRRFNGKPEIRFLLGGERVDEKKMEQTAGLDVAASLQARARRFMAVAVLPRLVLAAADSGKNLTCVAGVSSANAKQLTASIPLRIISLQPVIYCHDKIWASVTDVPLNITCIVEHTYTPVQDFVWENARTGEIMDREHANISKVYNTSVNATHSLVTLLLFELEKETVSNYYLYVITKIGPIRHPVVLLQDAEGQDLTSSSPTSTAVTTTTSVLLRLCLLTAAYLWTPCWHSTG